MENKKRKIFETVIYVIGILCGMGVIVFGALYLSGKMESGLDIAEIMLGVLMLLQGLRSLASNKVSAVASFIAAALIFAAALFSILM